MKSKKVVLKVLLIFFALCLASCVPAYSRHATESYKEKLMTWHEFEDIDDTKIAVFISGYMVGYRRGIVAGRREGIMETTGILPEFGVKPDIGEKISERSLEKANIYTLELLQGTHARLDRDPLYYVKELRSFFQAYPLCKGKDFRLILWRLIEVWDKEYPLKTTYKEIGDRCSNSW
ncbi:MAG: hypothetical protein AB1478_12550 [Nitrospirota bacterium]